jgi:hypothetical protein
MLAAARPFELAWADSSQPVVDKDIALISGLRFQAGSFTPAKGDKMIVAVA